MLKKTLAMLAIFALLLFSHPPTSKAQTILFSDDFNDGDSNGWDIIGDPGWNVQNYQYGINLNPGLSNSLPNDSLWNYGWTNIAYDVNLLGVSGVDKNILIKFVDIHNFIEIHANDHGIFLDKASTSGGGGTLWHVSTLLQNGVTYHFRTEINNNSHIKVFLDNNLIFDVDETTPILINWKVGLRAGTGSTSPTEVWFDNIVVTELPPATPTPTTTPTVTPIPTPVPTPTATPTPSPTGTPIPISSPIGNFELPFSYIGRLTNNASLFKNAFWGRLTAAFDHAFLTGIFRPFTGNTYLGDQYSFVNCPGGIFCYDSHNGTDFSTHGGQEVLSVASGNVVYSSLHDLTTCTPESTFGCVVIAKYAGNTYTLFAHLDKIFVNTGNSINASTQIGEMGATGCPGCGEHLHFGVLKPTRGILNSLLSLIMTKKDWQGLLSNIQSTDALTIQPFCSYSAPNGTQFYFLDPSGWAGLDKDPWSLPKTKGGCGVNSNYLWKFPIGVGP